MNNIANGFNAFLLMVRALTFQPGDTNMEITRLCGSVENFGNFYLRLNIADTVRGVRFDVMSNGKQDGLVEVFRLKEDSRIPEGIAYSGGGTGKDEIYRAQTALKNGCELWHSKVFGKGEKE